MSEHTDIEYLEDERKKMWTRIEALESHLATVEEIRAEIGKKCSSDDLKRLEDEFDKKLPDHAREAKTASAQVSKYWKQSQKRAKEIDVISERISDNDSKLADLVAKHQNLQQAENEATTILANIEASLQTVNSQKQKADTLLKDLKSLQEGAEAHCDKLEESVQAWDNFEEESLAPIKTKLEAARDNATKLTTEISKAHETVLGSTGLREQLEKAFDTLKSNFALYHNNAKKVFAEKQTGIEKLASDSETRYEKLLKEKEEAYTQLRKQINSLLPSAMTAGLASAYQEKRKQEENERKWAQITFYIAIGMMVVLAFIPVGFNAWLFAKEIKVIEEIIKNFPFTVVLILPLYAPVFWLAYVASKRVNQSKRLIEEYAHKEALSKTFEGLSTQIKQIEDSGLSGDLSIKLLYNLVKASSENPGELIKGFNKPDNPLLDVVDKAVSLSESQNRLFEIPGIGKFIEAFNRKKQEKIDTLKAKAEQGLSTTDEE